MTMVCELDIVLNDNLCNLQTTSDIMRILVMFVICLLPFHEITGGLK